jgi:microcystin-dependent protein
VKLLFLMFQNHVVSTVEACVAVDDAGGATMTTVQPGGWFALAQADGDFVSNARCNDVVVYSTLPSQRLLFGVGAGTASAFYLDTASGLTLGAGVGLATTGRLSAPGFSNAGGVTYAVRLQAGAVDSAAGYTVAGQALIPVGTMWAFAGAAVPAGWLACDGAAVTRAAYAALFAVIGTAYGAGDGATTFNVPDSRGRALVGAGQGAGLSARALGAAGGEEAHTLVTAETPAHTHDGTTTAGQGAHAHTQRIGTADDKNFSGIAGQVPPADGSAFTGATYAIDSTGSDHQHAFTTGAAGGGAAHNNMAPFLVVTHMIRAR